MMGYQDDDEEDDDEEERGDEDDRLYIEGSSGSEATVELGINVLNQQHTHSSWTTPLATAEDCPLVLVFPGSTGRPLLSVSPLSSSPSPSPCPTSRHGLHSELDEDLEYCDERIEEWMILGGEELEGDRNIHLNVYWSSSCSESESGTEDEEQNQKAAFHHNWAISAKDKGGVDQPRPNRYFTPDLTRALTCLNCNKTGHLAKSCSNPRRRPVCVLCGLQGHVQRGCPGRHCPSCGLPSHGHQACPEPPVWNQYCHRCGMTGHLTDACPDTWRQYHFTTQEEAPLNHTTKPQPRKRRPHSHCYNCSRRGHHGHECTMRRMVSGTFSSVPYVCHYDTKQDILKQNSRIQRRARELQKEGFMPLAERQRTSKPGGSGEEERSGPATGRLRSQDTRREARGKTWPERRRQRREVKRLRREAQARRGEGSGGPGRTREDLDLEVYPRDAAFRIHPRDPTPPPQKKRRNEERRRSRKSREAERWKKRGGLKHGDLHPRDDLGPLEENLLSPKHRVRHRRR